jgi:hypothetical protein
VGKYQGLSNKVLVQQEMYVHFVREDVLLAQGWISGRQIQKELAPGTAEPYRSRGLCESDQERRFILCRTLHCNSALFIFTISTVFSPFSVNGMPEWTAFLVLSRGANTETICRTTFYNT